MGLMGELRILRALAQLVVVALGFACASVAHAAYSDTDNAAALRARFGALKDQMSRNQFQKPLYLDSKEVADSVSGEIYAFINHPFATAGTALNGADRWCAIMMLHINTKHCRAAADGGGSVLQVSIGKKVDQPVADAYRVNFAFRIVANTADFLKVTLYAEQGPLSTRDYRVTLEAIPGDNGGTFIHLTYSYGYGLGGRVAMQAYLATVGRGKVGFTVLGKQADGSPQFIGGMRGVVERNTMRYYLAIESYMGALAAPPHARLEKSLRDWFAAIERYPRQLHELEQNEYLEMKRKEHLRLQADSRASMNPA
jgi:hypothetical protein